MNEAEDPQRLVADLVRLLDLETIEVDLFRGPRSDEPWRRVFGGQVIGQALMAAALTVERDKPAHSLHAYFMRPGDPALPIVYRVDRDRDGRSFASRRVVALQEGVPILNLAASFHVVEEGLHHQTPMPAGVPEPETLRSSRAMLHDMIDAVPERSRPALLRARPIEFRPLDQRLRYPIADGASAHGFWMRAVAPLPDDDRLHRAILAYATDMMLMITASLPHSLGRARVHLQEASLDHALWLHDTLRLDDWHLYLMDAPWSGGARGLNRGAIYARDGRLVASVAQEGLMRPRGS